MEKDHPYYGWTIKKLRKEKQRLKNNIIPDQSGFDKIEIIAKTIEEKKNNKRWLVGTIISIIILIIVIIELFCK